MMTSPRLWTSVSALILVLSVVLAPALAQKAKDSGDQMSRMMVMMGQMQEQMKRMHDDMAGMKGMGPMQGRMDHMMGMMGQMNGMMKEHHAEMGCMSSPDRPKPGG